MAAGGAGRFGKGRIEPFHPFNLLAGALLLVLYGHSDFMKIP